MNPDPKTVKDALDRESDFSFEMRTKKIVSSLQGGEVRHGGSYVDPLEKKQREFDIRFVLRCPNYGYSLFAAIECKSLSAGKALVVCGANRDPKESFHTFSKVRRIQDDGRSIGAMWVSRVAQESRVYPAGEFVGKKLITFVKEKSQLEKAKKADELYDKWSQALASSVDLCNRSVATILDGHRDSHGIVIPIVVVPSGCLWRAHYDESGELIGLPAQCDEVPYFVNYKVRYSFSGRNSAGKNLDYYAYGFLSHLHFMTTAGLSSFLSRAENSVEFASTWIDKKARFESLECDI